jgi:cell division septation protein DedD
MKTIFSIPKLRVTPWLILLLFIAGIYSAYAQEGSSANLRLIPSQERIPTPDWRVNPETSAPAEKREPAPAESPVVRNSPRFKAPLISKLERGKWYVQIGVYTKPELVDDAIIRAGSSAPSGTVVPVVIHNAGTDTNPMFRVLLGPFSQSESKTVMKRFRDKGYEAFLRSGN